MIPTAAAVPKRRLPSREAAALRPAGHRDLGHYVTLQRFPVVASTQRANSSTHAEQRRQPSSRHQRSGDAAVEPGVDEQSVGVHDQAVAFAVDVVDEPMALVLEGVRQIRGTSTSQVEGAQVSLVTSGEGVPTSAILFTGDR